MQNNGALFSSQLGVSVLRKMKVSLGQSPLYKQQRKSSECSKYVWGRQMLK